MDRSSGLSRAPCPNDGTHIIAFRLDDGMLGFQYLGNVEKADCALACARTIANGASMRLLAAIRRGQFTQDTDGCIPSPGLYAHIFSRTATSSAVRGQSLGLSLYLLNLCLNVMDVPAYGYGYQMALCEKIAGVDVDLADLTEDQHSQLNGACQQYRNCLPGFEKAIWLWNMLLEHAEPQLVVRAQDGRSGAYRSFSFRTLLCGTASRASLDATVDVHTGDTWRRFANDTPDESLTRALCIRARPEDYLEQLDDGLEAGAGCLAHRPVRL